MTVCCFVVGTERPFLNGRVCKVHAKRFESLKWVKRCNPLRTLDMFEKLDFTGNCGIASSMCVLLIFV